MTKRQPAYSAVPQSCRYLSARPVLNRLVHDSENAFGVLSLLAPFSRWCQVPTFWLSRHSRCPAAYQLRKHVRNSGNPRVLVPAHDLFPYPRRVPFRHTSCGCQDPRTACTIPRATGFPLPGTPSSPEGERSISPGLVTGELISCLFSSRARQRITTLLNG
mgnify:FL=1